MNEKPLSDIKPWDLVADGYVTDTQPIFEKYALDSFAFITLKEEHHVLDVACGPGTVSLLLAPLVDKVVALDFSPKMIANLEEQKRIRKITNIQTQICDCQTIPFNESQFDFAFSQFGVMFFQDRIKGFEEIYRVLKDQGKAVIYSWAPISESPVMQMFLGALQYGFPETKPKKDEAKKEAPGLDNKDTLRAEMEKAGFKKVIIHSVENYFPAKSPQLFWESMVRGSAQVTYLKRQMDTKIWNDSEAKSIQYLHDNLQTSSLSSKAYLAVGEK